MIDLYLYLDWILLLILSLAFCQQLFSKKFGFFGITSIISLAIYIALHSYKTGISIFCILAICWWSISYSTRDVLYLEV